MTPRHRCWWSFREGSQPEKVTDSPLLAMSPTLVGASLFNGVEWRIYVARISLLIAAAACGCGGEAAGPDGQPVASVVVNPSSDTLVSIGETVQLAASAYDVSGNLISDKSFAWTSSRPNCATVNASGLVTALKNGVTWITVTADGISATASVTVSQIVEAITVDPATVTLSSARGTMQLAATAWDAGDHAIPDKVFAWSSSDEVVATVDDSGMVIVVEDGAVTITATTNGVEGAAAITGVDGVINGNLESGDFYPAWTYGGTQNYSVDRVELDGNHMATVSVGAGPTGDASCTNSSFNNFGYVSQDFTLAKGQVVQLDYLTPVPGTFDPTENATCVGFDRIEIDFVVVSWSPVHVQTQLLCVLTVDYLAATDEIRARLSTIDANWTGITVAFDPSALAPFTVGPVTVEESDLLPGWLTMSMEVSDDFFPGLPEEMAFRITVRNEDNRNTGQHFEVSVDNVLAYPN